MSSAVGLVTEEGAAKALANETAHQGKEMQNNLGGTLGFRFGSNFVSSKYKKGSKVDRNQPDEDWWPPRP
jgi:hypothetical protein